MIRSAAVLGAGTMGAQLAAHLANAGVPVLLLDLTADVAAKGLERARALKPDPFFAPAVAALITLGGFDGDLHRASTADWIIEAVVEQLQIKQPLLERVEQIRRPGAIVTSNTSGIRIAEIVAGRGQEFRSRFLGTHFFNPPRYLRLVELIPTAETDPDVAAGMREFLDRRLGKGVVVAKDTPNFIANHIGIYGAVEVLRALDSGDYTIEEIDAITGPAIGRPKSATFRTLDIVGVDVLAHVARNIGLDPPAVVSALVERGWLGEKSGQGFYKRSGNDILTLDPKTMTYRPRQPARLPSLDAAAAIADVGSRIRTLFSADDKVGSFLRATLGPTLRYTATVAPDIAYSIDDVDRAMRWGFGWALGPFETMDAIGANEAIGSVLQAGRTRFRDDGLPPAAPDLQILQTARERRQIVKTNAGASLIDIGDGVFVVEFHSKMNAIGGDTVQMLHAGLKEASTNGVALVVGNDGEHFSAGANLMLILLEAQEGNWDEIDLMIRTLQRCVQAMRYADVPVVVAPGGMAIGGGCEIVLHADRVQASAESYIGLVEVGVGLIPAGGGTKEMLARAMSDAGGVDLLPLVQRVFETIGFAKVSTSAAGARALGFLTGADRVTMNRERLIADAKAFALERVREGCERRVPRTAIRVGGETLLAALKLGVHLGWRAGRLTDHDATIGRALATVLAGGALPHETTVTEEYLLDLEREAFLKLCGERKTLERIQHTLKTGKPLRN